ncbi:septum formation initiator family protein [Alicyclobacillus tolerans]|uniref:Septum formation initiator n=2 Tax=Alicyclobacillus tolerans TaxID=90970 RepID=A0A1M6Q353_9BACL|nr:MULTISPECIES: septum formation initiator family protein [Alicyclobacillus]MDP9728385.1 cell division protein FtsB [Alicyclobacillus tengchongensis]SHK14536.1 Septum formation initiator [Alicyclobacillus montanus]
MSAVRQMAVPVEHSRSRQSEAKPISKTRAPWREAIGNMANMALCAAVAVGAMWFLANRGAAAYSQTYSNVQLQTEISQMAAENASLNAEVDSLERPSRILSTALNKLHMVHANPIQISANSSQG